MLLTDFGIAQIDGDTAITRTGEVVGSVDYLAPERVRGHDPGPASDLWALGATLYTAVEGTSPFRRTSPLTTMQAVVEEEAGEPRHAGPLAPVIGALLRKDPATRPDAARTEQMLAEAAEGRRPQAAQEYIPTRAVDAHVPLPYETRPEAAPRYPQGGATAVVPQPYGPAAAPRRRVRGRVIALVVVVAAIVGGGTAVLLQQGEERGGGTTAGPSPTVTSEPAPTETGESESPGSLPEGWVRRTDPWGFSVVLPGDDWERVVFDEETRQVDYTPDGGNHFLRIAADDSPDFDDPYAHLSDLDQQIGRRLVDYRQQGLERGVYRDRESARLEYSWTALAKDTEFPGPRRAVDQMYISRGGTEYALYMSGPAEDWATTGEQFETLLKGWREP
ncbi:serine/threonine protein kinase [Streptomyces griseoflavus Tu4000]|uniref:non-specific serine/threonine protein kinase n=1 Tax=Streptomyces griseoflavus Tu4000 TaxID=467200 RepID=D9XV97_9ACTN|nr:serine/threonine protein kinase [Streptomyces griseoflavus Tu4000]